MEHDNGAFDYEDIILTEGVEWDDRVVASVEFSGVTSSFTASDLWRSGGFILPGNQESAPE